jgi:RNA polymerase sigma-70 factor (ECF subfamily)
MDKSPKQQHDENARLMLKAADGDIGAFNRLFQRYAPLLMYLFVKWGVDLNSAEDFVQKIFSSLWEQRKQFHLESSFEAYLYSMARNALYGEIRKSHKITKVIPKKQSYSDEGIYKALSQPEDELYLEELIEALEASKAKLTDEQLEALEISQDPDIDLHKTLKELGLSYGAYKGLIERARKQIREHLDPIFLEELESKKRRKRP